MINYTIPVIIPFFSVHLHTQHKWRYSVSNKENPEEKQRGRAYTLVFVPLN